jgi:hypothetical protein
LELFMPRNLVRLLALLAAAVLLLGACGDDDGDDASPTTEAPAATDDTTDDPSDDGDTTTTTTQATSGTGASGVPSQAVLAGVNDFCELFAMFEDIDPFEAGEDPSLTPEESAAQTAEAFQFIGAFFARAVQLSPDEIRSDVALFAEFMGEYNALLAEYDYDFMAMAMASADDPDLEARFEALDSEEFDAATTRIENYVFDECGIVLD